MEKFRAQGLSPVEGSAYRFLLVEINRKGNVKMLTAFQSGNRFVSVPPAKIIYGNFRFSGDGMVILPEIFGVNLQPVYQRSRPAVLFENNTVGQSGRCAVQCQYLFSCLVVRGSGRKAVCFQLSEAFSAECCFFREAVRRYDLAAPH